MKNFIFGKKPFAKYSKKLYGDLKKNKSFFNCFTF